MLERVLVRVAAAAAVRGRLLRRPGLGRPCWRLATRAARRHGLPLPIPATYRFPGVPDVDENAWQDTVVRHLGLEDWVRFDVTDELDLVGPVAAPLLRRFGPSVATQQPFRRAARAARTGGTFVTGVGGDELLEPSAQRAARALLARRRPRRRATSVRRRPRSHPERCASGGRNARSRRCRG